MDELSFDGWLSETQTERENLCAFAKESTIDMNAAIQKSADCGRLQRQAELYLTQMTAQYTLHSKEKYPQLSAEERKIMVKDSVKFVQFLVDAIAVTERAIRDRIYSQNRRY